MAAYPVPLLNISRLLRPSLRASEREYSGMNNDELIRFNPILAKALARAEEENVDPHMPNEYLRELVAASVKVGVSPDKIYAMIKTGRILTHDNMKLLSIADIREWQDSCHEYDRLAGPKVRAAKRRR
jgi:hypothetical protein